MSDRRGTGSPDPPERGRPGHDHSHAGHEHPQVPAAEAAPDRPPVRPGRPFVLRVGLTGGIATGKSTVARIFSGLGASVLDADFIARRLLEKEAPGYGPAVAAFGRDILGVDGTIDRVRLGRIVFAEPERRAALEAILHPLIRAEEARFVDLLADTGQGRIAVTNAALLIETGFYRDYHRVVVVQCSLQTQIDRILRRDGLSESDARARIAAQMDADEKARVAHYLIDTTAGMAQTEARARVVYRHLQQDLLALSEPV
jgi:dephospho-CoA kinase